MFDRIYQRRSVITRHEDGPWADERRQYLQRVAAEGRAPNTLMGIAAILLAVAEQFGDQVAGAITDADIARSVDSPASAPD